MSGVPPKPGTPKSQFPRSRDLPSQSPLFWVGQKDRYLRQLLIRDIEEDTQRRLIVYFANRYQRGSEIQAPDVANVAELLGDVGQCPVDLLLQTIGGLTDATEALVSLLRTTISDLRVIVVDAAKSNGTLLALASRSIVMGATSELGPIEPSFTDIPASILDTPQFAQINFPLHMLGKYALQQSRSIATKLLTTGMMAGKLPADIAATVEALATRARFASHGSVVDHVEAAALGLAVTYLPPDDPLWQRLWLLYQAPLVLTYDVMPAKAGIQASLPCSVRLPWIPAFAGMTDDGSGSRAVGITLHVRARQQDAEPAEGV